MSRDTSPLSITLELRPENIEANAEILLATIEAKPPELNDRELDAALARRDHADTWLTVADAAERLSVSKRTIYRALEGGEIRGDRGGSRWRLRRAALTAWLHAQALPPDRRTSKSRHKRRPVDEDQLLTPGLAAGRGNQVKEPK